MKRTLLLSSIFVFSLNGIACAEPFNANDLPDKMIPLSSDVPKEFLAGTKSDKKVKEVIKKSDKKVINQLADATVPNPMGAPTAFNKSNTSPDSVGYHDKDGYFRPGTEDNSGGSSGGNTAITSGAQDGGANGQQVVVGGGMNTGDGNGNGESDIREDMPQKNQDDIERRSFEKAMHNMFMPTDMIKQTKRRAEEDMQARDEPTYDVKPVIRSLAVTLKPNELPPTLHLAYGDMTALTFADVTGAPWYISKVDTDENAYNVPDKDSGGQSSKTNILTIAPKTKYSKGRNLVVYLEHSAVPVILSLDTGYSPKVDYRVDIAIMKRGPNARSDFSMEGISVTNDDVVQSFLDGLPPDKAHKVKSSSPQVEAWHYNHLTYIRTNLDMKSPMWRAHSNSNIAGVSVYVIADNIPNIIVSDNGRLSSVMLGN